MSITDNVKEQFIVDEDGHKTHVILKIEEYQNLLEDLEDLADLAIIKKTAEFVSIDEVRRNLGL